MGPSGVFPTVPEACELVRRRRLRTVRIGSRRVVPLAALDELVAALADEEMSP